jgi:protein SCO1/2
MKRNRWVRLAAGAAITCAALLGAALRPVAAAQSRWGADYFPNVALTTQNGDVVHFYDLIKGKIVAIDLMYTSCDYNCPLETARLAQVQTLLGDRMGQDVFFYSISIDPTHDTPAVLKTYAEQYHAGPSWLFLTGAPDDIDLLSKKLGLYTEPNPDNPDGHTPTLLIGNEATGQWMQGSALDNPQFTARLIGDWMNGWKHADAKKSYAEARGLATPGRGQYLFSTKCVACHTIGHGDKIGPDLAEVASVHDPSWLARYIAAPDKMREQGDPIAVALAARFKPMRMPNLSLTEEDAADILAYVDAQGMSKPK